MNYKWQGEINELQNIIERAIIFCQGDSIIVNDLPQAFLISEEKKLSVSPGVSLKKLFPNLRRTIFCRSFVKTITIVGKQQKRWGLVRRRCIGRLLRINDLFLLLRASQTIKNFHSQLYN